MRTISEKEKDDRLKLSSELKIRDAFRDYVELMNKIEIRRSKMSDETYWKQINEMYNRVLSTFFSGSDEDIPSNILTMFDILDSNSRTPKLLDGDKCPNCSSFFPGDIWQYYDSLFCPYCGTRVRRHEIMESDNDIVPIMNIPVSGGLL